MITKDSIKTAYSFLHQKRNVYIHSTLDWQKDDIELAIGSYVDDMSQELYEAIADGRADFLRDEEFDTLEALCYAFSRDPKQIKEYLYKRGFVWSEQQKQFRPIGYDQ